MAFFDLFLVDEKTKFGVFMIDMRCLLLQLEDTGFHKQSPSRRAAGS